jgi:uncharacterized protein (DUF2267 family)
MPNTLPIPAPAIRDSHSIEMIRVWIAEKGLHAAVNIGIWEAQDLNEPDAWGIMLADVVRHIANAHEEEYGRDPREVITAVRQALERELAKPTTQAEGSFVRKKAGE